MLTLEEANMLKMAATGAQAVMVATQSKDIAAPSSTMITVTERRITVEILPIKTAAIVVETAGAVNLAAKQESYVKSK
jgi:hypothetical protein